MIGCTVYNWTSCLHCESAYEGKGHYDQQSSWDTNHKTFDLPSLIVTSCSRLSLLLTAVKINVNVISSITFPFSDDKNWDKTALWLWQIHSSTKLKYDNDEFQMMHEYYFVALLCILRRLLMPTPKSMIHEAGTKECLPASRPVTSTHFQIIFPARN